MKYHYTTVITMQRENVGFSSCCKRIYLAPQLTKSSPQETWKQRHFKKMSTSVKIKLSILMFAPISSEFREEKQIGKTLYES
ncbi:hypothetical protein MUG91_G47n6 [Manis pentadactyla]|nr:hypothetical protein MUG91_G47n6 [Manis pentadactyla]